MDKVICVKENFKKDTRTIEQKIASLKKLGIIVSVKDANDDLEQGYIMGRMKDQCTQLEILLEHK